METHQILIGWLAITSIALITYSLQKNPTPEGNRTMNLWAGSAIIFATTVAMIFILDHPSGGRFEEAFIREYLSIIGSVIGGGLFVRGIQKKTKEPERPAEPHR